jgi:hypothetical protein
MMDAASTRAQDVLRFDEGFPVMNEFGVAYVRKVHTRNGERLEISSPRLGYKIRLDALQLEALSWQRSESLSVLMETPFGPEHDDD